MYLTKPNGDVVEIDDPKWIDHWKQSGFNEASEGEIATYKSKKQLMIDSSKLAEMGEGSVFYQTVGASYDGYGMSRDIIKRELINFGVILREDFDRQKVGLIYSYPYGLPQLQTDVRLIMTMFESDKLPEDWADYLALANEVIVPSKWCADVFAESGVEATVIPLGYNDDVFTYIDRKVPVEANEVFTFIHYNSFNIRKGFFEVFEAFNAEFGHDESVRLIIKSIDRKAPLPILPNVYPNIQVITEELPEKQLAELLGRAHCMVYPSRGEGFGITPLEAMATGMPAIVPNAHGISEYFNDEFMLEVRVKENCPGLYHRFKGQDVGEMVVCDVDHLRQQMRFAYNNQRQMKELGSAASEYVKKYTYKRTAELLAEVIKKWQLKDVAKRTDSKFLSVERV